MASEKGKDELNDKELETVSGGFWVTNNPGIPGISGIAKMINCPNCNQVFDLTTLEGKNHFSNCK